MFIKWRVSKTIQWIVKVFLIYLFIFTAFRLATVIFFKPKELGLLQLLPSFWLGLKYDLRWISFIVFPITFFSLFRKLSPFYSEKNKRTWTYYLGIITLLVLFFYGADFGQFAYANSRLNSEALVFTQDPKESLQMVWQTYPVIWILIGVAGAVLMMVWMFKRTHVEVQDKNVHIHKFSYRRRWHLVAMLLLTWFMYGFFTSKPLNFFRAFNLDGGFKSNLALNPLQNFFTTLGFREPEYETRAGEHYPVIEKFLNLKNNVVTKKGYLRIKQPSSNALETQPNIVLVFCESFSMYKSSMSGNPLNTTPYFNQLAAKGIFFERCFAPSFGTARGVFATLTGIPDVQLRKFATRNDASINQRSIINDFEGYEKMYFIGGRSQFNNLAGLVKNIEGVRIYEEGNYQSPKVNVWGISDRDLFLEANALMAKEKKPFFSIIQMADNQRPYNIPGAELRFVEKDIPADTLARYGFESAKEYNAFAYTDYSIKTFMEAAAKEAYFDNTIFVFVGDHGAEGNATAMYPAAWTEQRLTEEHVPLLFYSPALLAPQRRSETVSQIDVLPTIAGMLMQPYSNSTLGRNLLDSAKGENAAFIIYHAPGWIGVVNDQFYYRKNIRIAKEELVPVTDTPPILTTVQQDSVKRKLSGLSTAMYETARWMLQNNKKK